MGYMSCIGYMGYTSYIGLNNERAGYFEASCNSCNIFNRVTPSFRV